MSTDDTTHKSNGHAAPPPPKPPPSSPPTARTTTFPIPPAIKLLFDRFPLRLNPPAALPLRSPRARGTHTLHIFTTPSAAAASAPSFNPSCLAQQTLLHIARIPFRTVPSTNHASPTGALPFLLPSSPPHRPVSSHRLPAFAGLPPAPPDAAETLLTGPLRLAYLHALYLDPATFASLAAPLYVYPASSNLLVRHVLSATLAAAARTEVLAALPLAAAASAVNAAQLHADADAALGALSALLAERAWFGEGGPGVLDAEVFAYVHVVLALFDAGDRETPGVVLAAAVRRRGNLVAHRERVLREYYDEWWAQQTGAG